MCRTISSCSHIPVGQIESRKSFKMRPSTRIYARNIPDRVHPDPTWNDGALSPNKKKDENNTMSIGYEISSWSKNYGWVEH